jgi:hypothetical protein
MKIGDLVEFSLGTVPGEVDGIGVYAGSSDNGKHKVLYAGRSYELQPQFISLISIVRKTGVNDPVDN